MTTTTGSGKKKSLVFVTSAPGGTLGDPSATAKLVTRIKDKYPDIDFHIMLVVARANETAAVKLMPENVNVMVMEQLDFNNGKYQDKDGSYHAYKDKNDKLHNTEDLRKILESSDGVIMYPTFHHFSTSELAPLAELKKPTLVLTEYNFSDENIVIQNNLKQDWMLVQFTGLGKNNLGIYCTDESESLKNTQQLSQIDTPSDIAFRDFLLSGNAEKNYHQSHELYYGYFNKLKMDYNEDEVNPIIFIESCIAKSSPSKDVDIVLPIVGKDFFDASGSRGKKLASFKSIEGIRDYFKENTALLSGTTLEIHRKNPTTGKMEIVETIGTGTRKVRLINGFPFSPQTVDRLLKSSDPFVLATGDQSVSEAISHQKIFLYQSMRWKTKILKELQTLARDQFGENSKLLQFYQMQLDSNKAFKENAEIIKKFLSENMSQMQKEMQILTQHILKNNNLNKIPDVIMGFMNNPTAYVQACLSSDSLNYKQIIQLAKMFPQEAQGVYDFLKKNHDALNDFICAEYATFSPKELKDMLEICRQKNILSEDNIKNLAAHVFSIQPSNPDEFSRDLERYVVFIESDYIKNHKIVFNGREYKMSAFLKQMDKLNNAVQTEIPLIDKQVFKKSENLIEFQMECLEALKREVEDESEEYNSEASNVVKEIEEIQSQMATLPAEQIMKNNEIDKALARFPLLKSRYDKQFVRQLEKIKPLFTLFYDHEKGNVSLKLQRWEAEESSIKLDYDISAYQTEIGQYFKAMGLDISFSDLQYSEESESYIIPKDQLGNFMERNLNPPTPENLPKQHRAEPLIHANIRSEKTEPKESESSIMKDTSSARISKKTGG